MSGWVRIVKNDCGTYDITLLSNEDELVDRWEVDRVEVPITDWLKEKEQKENND